MKRCIKHKLHDCLLCALHTALIVIAGEYPKDDDRYIDAIKTAKQFDLDIGENDDSTQT